MSQTRAGSNAGFLSAHRNNHHNQHHHQHHNNLNSANNSARNSLNVHYHLQQQQQQHNSSSGNNQEKRWAVYIVLDGGSVQFSLELRKEFFTGSRIKSGETSRANFLPPSSIFHGNLPAYCKAEVAEKGKRRGAHPKCQINPEFPSLVSSKKVKPEVGSTIKKRKREINVWWE